jgi:hypothetical protein
MYTIIFTKPIAQVYQWVKKYVEDGQRIFKISAGKGSLKRNLHRNKKYCVNRRSWNRRMNVYEQRMHS